MFNPQISPPEGPPGGSGAPRRQVLEDWKTRSNSEVIVMAMTGLQAPSQKRS